MHETTRKLLDLVKHETRGGLALDTYYAAVDAWHEAGYPDLEPEGCPEGWVEVRVVVGVGALGDFAAVHLDEWHDASVIEDDLVQPARYSVATIYAPKPQPVTELPAVRAKEEA